MIGFVSETSTELTATGSYNLLIISSCFPVFTPDETIKITVNMFEPLNLVIVPSAVTNGCIETVFFFENTTDSLIFTHLN